MIHWFFAAYAGTALSAAVRESRWIFAVFEMVHLTGRALLGGALLIAGAQLAGWSLGAATRAQAWGSLRWVALAGLAGIVGSGVVMVGGNPLKYYYNPAFNVKLWLLLVMVLTALVVNALVHRPDVPKAVWRVLGAALPLLFLSVGLAGRAIGLL